MNIEIHLPHDKKKKELLPYHKLLDRQGPGKYWLKSYAGKREREAVRRLEPSPSSLIIGSTEKDYLEADAGCPLLEELVFDNWIDHSKTTDILARTIASLHRAYITYGDRLFGRVFYDESKDQPYITGFSKARPHDTGPIMSPEGQLDIDREIKIDLFNAFEFLRQVYCPGFGMFGNRYKELTGYRALFEHSLLGYIEHRESMAFRNFRKAILQKS